MASCSRRAPSRSVLLKQMAPSGSVLIKLTQTVVVAEWRHYFAETI